MTLTATGAMPYHNEQNKRENKTLSPLAFYVVPRPFSFLGLFGSPLLQWHVMCLAYPQEEVTHGVHDQNTA